jgi:hypothetical protein
MTLIHLLLFRLLKSRLIIKIRWCINQLNIFKTTRCDYTISRLDLKNIPLQNRFLECVLLTRLTRVSPRLQLNLVVRRQFKLPFYLRASDILDSNDDLPGLH